MDVFTQKLQPHFRPKSVHATPRPTLMKPASLLAILLFLSGTPEVLAQSGSLDLSYPTDGAPNDYVVTLIDQGSGRILVSGKYIGTDGFSHANLLRMTPEGTVDQTFSAGKGPNLDILSMAVRADGKIVLGGLFSQFNGLPRSHVALINADGALDAGFDPGTGPNLEVLALLPLPGNSVLIGGAFTQIGVSPRGYLARLKPTGAYDETFLPGPTVTDGPNGAIRAMAALPDGRVMIAGDFTRFSGVPRVRIARIFPDGTLDPSFDPGPGPNNSILSLAPTPDGGWFIGGTFSSTTSAAIGYLARLTADGSLDAQFNLGLNGQVTTLSIAPDGKLVFGGDFTLVDGRSRSRVARLRTDRQLDLSFDPGAGCNGPVHEIATPIDGSVILGGRFTQVDNQPHPYLARLFGLSDSSGGEFEFTAPAYSVSESKSSVTLEVRRAGNSSSAVTVDYATTNGTANAGDYVPQTGKLTFAPGETRKSFSLAIRQDNTVEDDETVILALSNPTGGASLGAQRTASLLIENDDLSTNPGNSDTHFKASLNGNASAVVEQSDNKCLVAGQFTAANGISRLGVARFNEDGSLDPAFQAPWFNGAPLAIQLQADGKILVGGQFTVLNGYLQSRLARLNPDGTMDPSFDVGSGPGSDVYAILPLPTGDILVGGAFTTVDGLPRSYLALLFSDGSLDIAFPSAFSGGAVRTMALQADGKVLVGGDFTAVNGQPRVRIARLNGDGTLDPSFDPGPGPGSGVFSLATLSDGRILVGGLFSSIDFTPIPFLARLFPDGALDPSFRPRINGDVRGLLVQEEDKIVVVGEFSQAGGLARSRIVRLVSDGTVDPSFDVGAGFNAAVNAICPASGGDLAVVGNFTQYNGVNRPHVAHLLGLSQVLGGEIEFTRAAFQVSEGEGSATVEVHRTGTTSTTITVDFTTSNGTANAGDYTAVSSTLAFAPGETRKTISIPIRTDNLVEDDETILLTLSNPTGGSVLGSQPTAVLTILNDDQASNPGNVDTSFVGTISAPCDSLLTLPNGQFIATGFFTRANDQSRLYLARFNPDGQLTPGLSFSTRAWFNDATHSLTLQPDGKIIVAGQFTLANGAPRKAIARLNPDGSFDRSFDPGAGANGSLLTSLVTRDGDILVGGTFTTYGLINQSYLTRLYSDGSQDLTYKTAVAGGAVRTLVRQADGRILVGGDFTEINGLSRHRLARLEADGTLDRSFDIGLGFDGSVYAIALQPDGRILVGGSFATIDGRAITGLARLDATGHVESGFSADFNGTVYALAVQPGNLILAGGNFTRVQGQNRGRIARLRLDGSLDASFDTGAGFNDTVRVFGVQADGSILAGGDFTQFNSMNRSFLVRLVGLDNSAGGSIEFAAPTFQAIESGTNALIEVRRSGNSSLEVSVEFATSNGTATAADYTAVKQHLVFAPGETQKIIPIPIRPDAIVEDDETVALTLASPAGGAALGPQNTATLVLLNDDRFFGFGTLDTEFPASLDGDCLGLALQPDGNFIAIGNFLAANNSGRTRIARFTPDGALDPTFGPGVWLSDAATAIALQKDGRILLGGRFTLVNDLPRRRLARLNPDGSLDPVFDPGSGPNGDVLAFGLPPDGGILLAGSFLQYSGSSHGYILRLLDDATVDADFSALLNGPVRAMVVQNDGRILIGGDFTKVNGTSRSRLARLLPDGSLDATFAPAEGTENSVLCLALQPDGRLLVGGMFRQLGGVNVSYLGRLDSTGQVDVAFSQAAALNGYPSSFALQADGRIVVGGAFTGNGTEPRNGILRLNADGTDDPSFAVGTGADAPVNAMLQLADGGYLLGGKFKHFNGISSAYLARLHGYLTPHPMTFTGINAVGTGQLQISLSGDPGQSYVLQHSEDLLNWVPLITNTAPAATFSITIPATSASAGEYFRTISVR